MTEIIKKDEKPSETYERIAKDLVITILSFDGLPDPIKTTDIQAILGCKNSGRAYKVIRKLVQLDFVQPVKVKGTQRVTKYAKRTSITKEMKKYSREAKEKLMEESEETINI